jgi:hypothetical protein
MRGGEKMRKLSFAALLVLVGTGVAFASSLAIPWFADTLPANVGAPVNPSVGKGGALTGLLKSK